MQAIITVIIPAYNEQDSIANVVNDIPEIVNEIIVINNNSTDNTAINAKMQGPPFCMKAEKAMDMPA